MRPLEIQHLDLTFVSADWHNLVIALWRGSLSLARMKDVLDQTERSMMSERARAQGAGLWLVADGTEARLGVDVATYASLRLAEFGPELLFQVACVDAAAGHPRLRTALANTIAVGATRPALVASGTEEAAAWISPRVRDVSTSELLRVLQHVCRALDATPTPLVSRAVRLPHLFK